MTRAKISFSKLTEPYLSRLQTILIDGDILVYTIGFAVEESIEWPDGTTEWTGNMKLARAFLDYRIEHFTHSIAPGIDWKLVITGDAKNWRLGLDGTYKSTRGRKPENYKGIRDYMKSLDVVEVAGDGLEADDYLAARASAEPKKLLIVSFDKDFFAVPGTFVHMAQNSSSRLYEITKGQAMCFLFFQSLAGDPVDSYKGVEGIGKKKAQQLLKLADVKGLTVRQMYLRLKAAIKQREANLKKKATKLGAVPDMWAQFRNCIDLASLTLDGEEPGKGIGVRRVWKERTTKLDYFLPYYDVACTHEHTKARL